MQPPVSTVVLDNLSDPAATSMAGGWQLPAFDFESRGGSPPELLGCETLDFGFEKPWNVQPAAAQETYAGGLTI
jgi:hypothetical protein